MAEVAFFLYVQSLFIKGLVSFGESIIQNSIPSSLFWLDSFWAN